MKAQQPNQPTTATDGHNNEDKSMANMKTLNKSIKFRFPDLDIEAVRGDGYVYFIGKDGLDVVDSIYSNPPTTDTRSMIVMCLENIERSFK